jgi:flagellar motor protein MotB
MIGIKIKSCDKYFSLCIRERSQWHCERCSKYYPPGMRMGIHCSHFHGRGKWGVRFDPFNCEALCFGCHQYLGSQPNIHTQEKIQRIGQHEFDLLLVRAHSGLLGKNARKAESEIAKHYRNQHKIMQEKRNDGVIGRLEFEGFQLI